MKRLRKLNENDLLNKSHFPVQALFNELYEEEFLDTVVSYISKGHGFGAEYGSCVFPNDLDEYEIATRGTFDGVEFGLHNGEEILLDYDTFYRYLKIVCERYLDDNPEDVEALNAALKIFNESFC